ncbi:MAG: NGG1p interacting factor NIF3 [Actinobacteria bacterium]|nr:NGG1p interacting factor NIF3 [Actinomycetota bacterium]
MKLRDMYETAVRVGIQADPRGQEGVRRYLDQVREQVDKLPDYLKQIADPEDVTNPFSDTRIYVGEDDADVTTLLAGIDMNVGEILLADRLREKGTPVDAVYTHHPEGWGLSKLDSVMSVQADIWARLGVPIQAGERLINERRKAVRHRFMPLNATQAIDAARLLGIPFFSAHTPTDNLVYSFLTRSFDERDPQSLEDVRKVLFDIPEYRIAATQGSGPSLGDSAPESRCGKVFVDMTGGTEGPVEAIEQLAHKGVGTIVCMHMGDELRKAADEHRIHIVIAGHMASDSLGINLLLDEYQRRGVRIIPTSGLIRVCRDEALKALEEQPAAVPR